MYGSVFNYLGRLPRLMEGAGVEILVTFSNQQKQQKQGANIHIHTAAPAFSGSLIANRITHRYSPATENSIRPLQHRDDGIKLSSDWCSSSHFLCTTANEKRGTMQRRKQRAASQTTRSTQKWDVKERVSSFIQKLLTSCKYELRVDSKCFWWKASNWGWKLTL